MVSWAMFLGAITKCSYGTENCFLVLCRAALSTFRLLATKRRSTKLGIARIRHCAKRCPFYDSARKTCGQFGAVTYVFGIHEPSGCGCYMPAKVPIPEATCWLNEKTNGHSGWPKELQ